MEQAQLLKGVLEIAVLAVLDDGETYGYDILSRLDNAGLSGVGHASVYGTLRRLEQAGHPRPRPPAAPQGPAREDHGGAPAGPKAAPRPRQTRRRTEPPPPEPPAPPAWRP